MAVLSHVRSAPGAQVSILYAFAILPSLLAALACLSLTPLVCSRRPGDARGVDDPSRDAVPRLGGIAIFASLTLTLGLVGWLGAASSVTTGAQSLLALAVGVSLVFLIGLFDDLRGASPLQKLTVQTVAAMIVVFNGWTIESMRLPGVGLLDLGVFGTLFSLVWVVGVTNAINLLDGLDGLAAGAVAIISLSFLVTATLQENVLAMAVTAAVFGACLGFLRYNWHPARVFMGDSGSLTLGFLLAVVSIQASLKGSAAATIFVPILALGVPLHDTLLVMWLRFTERRKRPLGRRFLRVLQGDHNHLHHRLQAHTSSEPRIVLTIHGLVVVSCVFSLCVGVIESLQLGPLLLAIEFLVILLLRRLSADRAGVATPAADRVGSSN